MDLGSLNAGNVSENTAMWEKVLRRLRARRDPPANSPRPDDKTYRSVISRLEQALDGAYSASNPLNVGERVTDAEWASRIAALLWGSAPDASLLADARNGSLHDPAVLNRHVVRMLRDPKSLSLVSSFLEPWLSLDQLKGTSMDPELLQSMESETRLFLESQLREDHGVLELWTATYTYLNDRLARRLRHKRRIGKRLSTHGVARQESCGNPRNVRTAGSPFIPSAHFADETRHLCAYEIPRNGCFRSSGQRSTNVGDIGGSRTIDARSPGRA